MQRGLPHLPRSATPAHVPGSYDERLQPLVLVAGLARLHGPENAHVATQTTLAAELLPFR
jgi:hypothetical protein